MKLRRLFWMTALLLCLLAVSAASADTVSLGSLGASVEFPVT